jgi:protein-disulfide isomerase
MPRSWLYGGLAAVTVAVVVALILVSQLSGGDESPPLAVSGNETAALLDGIPQDGASLGSPGAPVVLYVFADLQCPFCREWDTKVLPSLVGEYVRSGDVRIVFRGLAFIGPDSEKALRTALAAGAQDRLWYVVNLLYLHQGDENKGWVTDDLVDAIGRAVPGLEPGRMADARDSGAVDDEVASAAAQADSYGISSTPSFLIAANGGDPQLLEVGSLEPEPFREAIDAALGR